MYADTVLMKYALFFFLAASVCSAGILQNAIRIKQRQPGQNCDTQLINTLPKTCNRSLLTGGIPIISSSELAAMNAAYAQSCVSACINPILQYYSCLGLPEAGTNMAIRLLLNGTCGLDNGEYCPIKANRLAIYNSSNPYDTCPGPSESNSSRAVLICNSTTPQSCYDDLYTFSSRLGCCATGVNPFLIQNCGVTFDPPCGSGAGTITSTPTSITPTRTPTGPASTSSPTSPANGLYPPFAAISIAAAIFGLIF